MLFSEIFDPLLHALLYKKYQFSAFLRVDLDIRNVYLSIYISFIVMIVASLIYFLVYVKTKAVFIEKNINII